MYFLQFLNLSIMRYFPLKHKLENNSYYCCHVPWNWKQIASWFIFTTIPTESMCSCEAKKEQHIRLAEWLGLEETLKITLSKPPACISSVFQFTNYGSLSDWKKPKLSLWYKTLTSVYSLPLLINKRPSA